MDKIILSDLPWAETRSPGGSYHLFQKHLSLALGGKKDTSPSQGGHPFDVTLVQVPPGTRNWPIHQHSSQWEFYIVLSGQGVVHTLEESLSVSSGEAFLCPPETAHQVENTGDEPLLFYVIANNPDVDIIYYPHSDKWFLKPQRKCFRIKETDYYENEE